MTVTTPAPSTASTGQLSAPAPLLAVRDLTKRFGPGCSECEARTGHDAGTSRCDRCGTVLALEGATFDVGPGEVLGIVGESGSGKTTLLRMLHLDARADRGSMHLDGVGDLVDLDESRRRTLRLSDLVLVHQDPRAAGLRPALAAGANVAERLLSMGERRFEPVRVRSEQTLAAMEVDGSRSSDPLSTFSGGMRQRVQLARALVSPPRVLLLDEPTTGLDPSVQAALLDVLLGVADAMAGATIVVSHDLKVVRLLADRVLVLRCGRVVEEGPADQILLDPAHPYTQLLVSSQL